MKKKIWIMNHYATETFFNKGGRHYWFAENLKNKGYEPVIFCANTRHNSKETIDTGDKKFVVNKDGDFPFVFVKTSEYKGNGLSRVKNMVNFFINLMIAAKGYAKEEGKADIILASSVHPLTILGGIRIARKFNVPCIGEVRDLWPESIVEFAGFKRNNLLIKLLYEGEKWIYKKVDKLIFTMEGGSEYIKDKKWNKEQGGPIDIGKVNHINNGIDLLAYDKNIIENEYKDIHLDDDKLFKLVYAGSIRKANNLSLIIDGAKYVQDHQGQGIKFLIFGDGDEKEILEKRCKDEGINNVSFKGNIEKRYIPNILSKSDLNILNYSNHGIWKYGGSQNKNFEYLASGKPVLSTIKMGYDIIERYNAGISLGSQTPQSIGKAVISISEMEEDQYQVLSKNAREAAKEYDFTVLTDKLIDIIESV